MTTIENEDVLKGSWAPTITVVIILIMRWLITSQGNLAVSLRRMMQMQVCAIIVPSRIRLVHFVNELS